MYDERIREVDIFLNATFSKRSEEFAVTKDRVPCVMELDLVRKVIRAYFEDRSCPVPAQGLKVLDGNTLVHSEEGQVFAGFVPRLFGGKLMP